MIPLLSRDALYGQKELVPVLDKQVHAFDISRLDYYLVLTDVGLLGFLHCSMVIKCKVLRLKGRLSAYR